MNDEQRIRVLEEELKVLKNEVKSVLLDLREQYLNIQNPFNASMAPNVGVGVSAGAGPQAPASAPVKETRNEIKDEAEDEVEDLVDELDDEQPTFGSTDNDLNDAPGSPPPEFESRPETPGFGKGIGGFNPAAGLPQVDPFAGAGPGPAQPENYLADAEEDEIPSVAPQPAKSNGKKKEQATASGNTKYDLMVVAGLTQWIDQSTARLGKERAEALVEMSYTMGRLPENLKDALVKMVRITKNESNGHNVTASDYLAILAQLENLLGKTEMHDNALLSLISMMKETGK